MNNDLADFLTKLNALRSQTAHDCAEHAIGAYYSYLEGIGIEHCNFGGFKITADGIPSINQFSGTRLSDHFIEEFSEELAGDDYVLRRAQDLSAERPIAKFETGLPVLDEIEAFHAPARNVQIECARQGIEEGVALLGNTSLGATGTGDRGGRYFGFVFGGERGTRALLSQHGQAVEIASFALLDRIMPQVEARIDGVEANLSVRERDVLAALARGAMRKQIAFDFNIALPTVDMYIAAIKRKLDAGTLPEAVAKGYRYGLL